jgi:antitoxin YqcF
MPADENKALAKRMHQIFGGKSSARVIDYLNNNESICIPLLICPDHPDDGLITHMTIGLSDYPMYQDDNEFHVRTELIGVCDGNIDWFPNVLASVAFHLIRTSCLFCPGSILKNVLADYDSTVNVKHFYFTSPFLWEDELQVFQLKTKRVACLMCILITDSEYEYFKQYGDEQFEELLEQSDVDIFNVRRDSII